MKQRIAFDTKLMRPGCVIVQAAMGGSSEAASKFPVESWLVHPTPDMQVFEATEEQLEKLQGMVAMRMQQEQQGDRP